MLIDRDITYIIESQCGLPETVNRGARRFDEVTCARIPSANLISVPKEDHISALAFNGEWEALIGLLKADASLANHASATNGYTPLSQAAWHGAPLAVTGALLRFGASKRHTTNKGEMPQQIAARRHPDREDLQYALVPTKRTIAQLMRKVKADSIVFYDYDGNQLIFDRIVSAFDMDECPRTPELLIARFSGMFTAITGVALDAFEGSPTIDAPRLSQSLGFSDFTFLFVENFWSQEFLPAFYGLGAVADAIPIERPWAVVADLFDPEPCGWGLRGDPFLWLEMRQALSRVSLPESPKELAVCIGSAFGALTGHDMKSVGDKLEVPRLQRGGMSGGLVSGKFWNEVFTPLIQRRYKWLHEMQPE